MRGLIRHNIYTITTKLKMTIVINLMFAAILYGAGLIKPSFNSWIPTLIILELASFAVQSVSTMESDHKSRWDSFEITMPVRRRDVIKSRYISILIYGAIALAVTLCTTVFFCLFVENLDLERIFFSLTIGTVILLGTPALMHPLLLVLGTDKMDTIVTISVILVSATFIGLSLLANLWFSHVRNLDLYFRIFGIVIYGILFLISGVISVHIYDKKEF